MKNDFVEENYVLEEEYLYLPQIVD